MMGIGSQGAGVTQWQTALSAMGFPVVQDGIFGTQTLAATKQAQAMLGVSADGIVGPQTQNAYAAWAARTGYTPESDASSMPHAVAASNGSIGIGTKFLIAGLGGFAIWYFLNKNPRSKYPKKKK